MDNILDQVLNNTAAYTRGPRIVSEVHDLNRINVEGADGIGRSVRQQIDNLKNGGSWDEGEYGISRAAQIARLEAADTPEAQARELEGMRRRAVRRAALDTTGGKVAVVVVGEPAWHKLGVNVADALTAKDAIRLASLDWEVSKRALSFQQADGTFMEVGDAFAIVRDDSQAALGVVGSRYRPIQNADGFDFLDGVIGEFGARFHTAGAIFGGSKVWMQCELPRQAFEVVKGDEVQAFATFTNPHDGSGKAWCFPTTNRIVCANTFRTASSERSKGLGVRHTGDVRAAIGEARQVLGLAVQEISHFKEAAGEMVRTPCDAPVFFEGLLDAVLDMTQADALKGADALAAALKLHDADRQAEAARKFQREIDTRRNVLDEILERYDGERCGVGGTRGTQWGAFNAITEYADYTKPRRQIGSERDRLSRRFESVINGDADEIKQTAYQQLATMRA